MDARTGSGSADGQFEALSHSRLLAIMAAVGVVGTILSGALFSAGAGAAFFLGAALAFANYYWLRSSLARLFSSVERKGENVERPGIAGSGIRFFIRYFLLAAVIAAVYFTNALPVAGVIFGLGSFAAAVIIEAVFRIFSRPA